MCLLVDNCSLHRYSANFGNMKLRFLPPNPTSDLQPLDKRVIHSLKAGDRKRLVGRLLQNLRVGRELKIDFLCALSTLSGSWADVTKETTRNCFRRAGFRMPSYDLENSAECNKAIAGAAKVLR